LLSANGLAPFYAPQGNADLQKLLAPSDVGHSGRNRSRSLNKILALQKSCSPFSPFLLFSFSAFLEQSVQVAG
jgi:hypothetical protein